MPHLITTPAASESSLSHPETRAMLEEILTSRLSGVLGSCFMDIPLCSQMAFAATEDLRTLIVATPRQSTKYENMSSNPNVSFLLTTSKNAPDDSAAARSLTATAFATELEGERRHQALNLFGQRHPTLMPFASSRDTAIMELKVGSYCLVSNFQGVTWIRLESPATP